MLTSAMALDSFREVAALGRSSVPGGGVRDSRSWQDTAQRVTLINDEDEGGERDGHGQDDALELLSKEVSDADLDFPRERLRVLMQAVMEAEVTNQERGQLWRAQLGSDHLPRRRPGPALRHPCGHPLGLQVPNVREGNSANVYEAERGRAAGMGANNAALAMMAPQ